MVERVNRLLACACFADEADALQSFFCVREKKNKSFFENVAKLKFIRFNNMLTVSNKNF